MPFRSKRRPDADDPAFLGLGSRVEQILHLAEEQATEIVAHARAEADRIVAKRVSRQVS